MNRRIADEILIVILTLVLLSIVIAKANAGEPAPTINVPCKVIEVYDGDTITVRVTLDIRVRLLDCWAPEIRTKDSAEKARGLESKQRMIELTDGRHGVLVVPLSGVDRLDDVFTFGRLLGRVYIDGKDVSAIMVRDGYATKTKTKTPKEMEVDP